MFVLMVVIAAEFEKMRIYAGVQESHHPWHAIDYSSHGWTGGIDATVEVRPHFVLGSPMVRMRLAHLTQDIKGLVVPSGSFLLGNCFSQAKDS